MMITQEEADDFAHHWVRAWNAHDLVDIQSHYADDVILVSPVAARILEDSSGTVKGTEAGSLVRPGGTESLGNTADADIEKWAESVARVRDRIDVVVSSHGSPAGPELLDHTIALVENHRKPSIGG